MSRYMGPRKLVAAGLLWGSLLCPGADTVRAAEILTPDATVTLGVHEGRAIRLAAPAEAVFVADPAIADVQAQSPTLLYLFGKRAGKTSLFAVADDQRVVLGSDVVVQHNLAGLRETLRSAAPDTDLTVQSVEGGLVLSGTVESATEAQELREIAARYLGQEETLVNRLRVGSPTQVSLHVRVAEVSRETARLFGVNWDTLFSPGDFVFGLATGRPFGPGGASFNRLTDTGGTAGTLFGGFASGQVNVNTLIDALENEGLVTVLAEPNLTALSGETASFLAGGEFPIPVGADDNEIQIEFKQFGVSLAFTPTVLAPDRISLRVRPEVSEISDKGAIRLRDLVIPALATRRAETTIELASGQSFAVGGLISNDTRSSVQKFPGLGDLPVLGTLFRSTSFQRNQTELVIIVTPYLVQPTTPDRLRTPLDRLRPASDLERILNARLVRDETAPGVAVPAPAHLTGAAGFILE
ncbi:type II and III secretion system protein family protein [Geminicoccaceae bacterium 1502E]|nr:type II and III secretion system protein family protein [Geminicoccaceae bacterium 1502E]